MKLLLLLVLLFFSKVDATESPSVFKKHIRPTLSDGFDKTGLWIVAGGVVATLLAQTQDYPMRSAWRGHQRMNSSAARVGDFLGTGIPGVSIALTQILFDREAGIAHSEALFDTFLTTSILKYTSGRARPSSDNHHSMPSGHTSTSFATATHLTYFYGWKAALPSYLLASFVAASRWSDDAHWFSDTVAGAVIGFFWGRATSQHHLQLLPVVDSKTVGLAWRKNF